MILTTCPRSSVFELDPQNWISFHFSPQNLMSPQCNWTLGMLCCDECNWILRCFRKERSQGYQWWPDYPWTWSSESDFSRLNFTTGWCGWLGGCSCKTSYEANREGRPGLAIQHSCLCLSHTSMNDRWKNFGPRVFQGNNKEFQNETREHVLDLCLALFTFLWLENKWGPISHL